MGSYWKSLYARLVLNQQLWIWCKVAHRLWRSPFRMGLVAREAKVQAVLDLCPSLAPPMVALLCDHLWPSHLLPLPCSAPLTRTPPAQPIPFSYFFWGQVHCPDLQLIYWLGPEISVRWEAGQVLSMERDCPARWRLLIKALGQVAGSSMGPASYPAYLGPASMQTSPPCPGLCVGMG